MSKKIIDRPQDPDQASYSRHGMAKALCAPPLTLTLFDAPTHSWNACELLIWTSGMGLVRRAAVEMPLRTASESIQ